jgi:hypothetical protein
MSKAVADIAGKQFVGALSHMTTLAAGGVRASDRACEQVS